MNKNLSWKISDGTSVIKDPERAAARELLEETETLEVVEMDGEKVKRLLGQGAFVMAVICHGLAC